MIVEQIRYFIDESGRDALLEARRRMGTAREEMGVPPGQILLADDGDDGAPCLLWQCLYDDEAEMGAAETHLLGHEAYEEARRRLGEIGGRVEIEIYVVDEP